MCWKRWRGEKNLDGDVAVEEDHGSEGGGIDEGNGDVVVACGEGGKFDVEADVGGALGCGEVGAFEAGGGEGALEAVDVDADLGLFIGDVGVEGEADGGGGGE